MTMTKLKGPFADARVWLIQFMLTKDVKNETLSLPLHADWSSYGTARSAYVLGAIWGRLRQMYNELESAEDYYKLVLLDIEDDTETQTQDD
jgi:hypothetical protein